MPKRKPTESDRREAIRSLLVGLRRGTELPDLALSLEALHPRDNTFPGEVFMEVAVQAMDLAGIEQRDLPYEELLNNHLPEYEFRDRRAQKIKFAILATGASRGGISPDLLDEVIWWRTDDFWFYALAAAAAIIRSSAAKQAVPIADLIGRLALEHDIDLTIPTP
ncbi:MAG TPA: hypothetical protein VII76_09060 [Acidimicrobiales bacterium]